ncbi:acyltransferase [Mesorhizobium sp. M0340]|uniref:acyltransferase n=1 Tax=Mesorhizobium sp. M0340 TaxID=2956939 RepID=UPI0033380655
MFRKICAFLYMGIIRSHSRLAIPIRRLLIQAMIGRKTPNLIVRADVNISSSRNLILGRDVSINHNVFLLCEGGLKIGDFVSIAHSTSIITTEHSYSDPDTPIKFQPIQRLPVVIGSNIWIGSRVTILAGVRIANGTVVAAGAVVTRSIDVENTIVGGVPARHIKMRF